MSGNTNRTRPNNPRRVLMVVANATNSSVTGWPVGFWWAELTHPYVVFEEAGYEIDIVSPEGGKLQADSWSDPDHDSGYSAHDFISRGFAASPTHAALLDDSPSIDGVNTDSYDAIFLVGGQSPMVSFIENRELHRLVANFYEAGKVTALVCHATCVLLRARLENGQLLASGRTWTGFSNVEEKFADDAVGQRLQPFWIETEARKIDDTNFIVGPAFSAFALRDGNLVTGQQQYSGAAAARLVVEAVGR